jgi:hypothetical protein
MGVAGQALEAEVGEVGTGAEAAMVPRRVWG